MSQSRLSKWLVREVGEDKADQVIAFAQLCSIVPLNTEIALAAADACRRHKLAMADAIVFAPPPRTHDADLITCDQHFDGLPGVTLMEKLKV